MIKKKRIEKIPFIVQTGNFRVKVIIPKNQLKRKGAEYNFIEAATQAMEFCDGASDNFDNNNCELLSFFDLNNDNLLIKDDHLSGDSIFQDFIFDIFLTCHLEDDANKPENWRFFLTSEIFANAGQHNNFILAKDFEKQYKDDIRNFNKWRDSLKKYKKKPKNIKNKKKKNS